PTMHGATDLATRPGFGSRETAERHILTGAVQILPGGGVTIERRKYEVAASESSTRYAGAPGVGRARYSRWMSIPAADANRRHRRRAKGAGEHTITWLPAASAPTSPSSAPLPLRNGATSATKASAGAITYRFCRHRSTVRTPALMSVRRRGGAGRPAGRSRGRGAARLPSRCRRRRDAARARATPSDT